MIKKLQIIFYVLKNLFLLKIKKVSIGNNIRLRGPVTLEISNTGKLVIGDCFSLTSSLMLNPLGRNIKSMIRVDSDAEVIIGNNVGMSCVSIWAKNKIIIGNNVKLGSGVIVMDSNIHSLDYKLRMSTRTDALNAVSKRIIIGDHAFIGVNSIITKDVSIGKRSIVAAGSVVVKSIPNDEIWGGNPAKFISKINANK